MKKIKHLLFLSFFILSILASNIFARENSNLTIENVTVNSDTVGKYDLVEITFDLSGAIYSNPYDPEEIDVRGDFFAPSGKKWEIFGFFDDYKNRSQWKIRFAANETGNWQFKIKATDTFGSAESDVFSFFVKTSQRHGWVHVSKENPNYLVCDDGTDFYGVGMCYPWNVTWSGLNRLAQHGANIFFYWNGTYDDAGNGGGNYLIESINSGIGRYDRYKCGRLDELLDWSRQVGIKMFLVIWPHDYLADNLTGGWVNQWQKNPYKEICRAEEFYGSELAWKYQKKLYRYIIARWSYSENLAGWQIICEITGTDGWVFGHESEAEMWSQRVHDFFQQNDPFDHPTTGSQHGYIACDWQKGYEIFDLPDREMYEMQGWPVSAGNPLRSSLLNYRTLTLGMSQPFQKPVICGETGYTLAPVPAGSENYDRLYHNALWVTLASGMSSTPFWWAYSGRIVSQNMLDQLLVFSNFVKSIDFRSLTGNPIALSSSDGDGACIVGDSLSLGWFRQTDGLQISGAEFDIPGLPDGSYQCQWIDPWTGEEQERSLIVAIDGLARLRVPDFSKNIPDAAFLINSVGQGDIPYKLDLFASKKVLFANGRDSVEVTCVITDSLGRICAGTSNVINFHLSGPGEIVGEASRTAENGFVQIFIKSQRQAGETILFAESPGLQSDSLIFQFKNFLVVDDFQSYASTSHLTSYWQIYTGTQIQPQLESGEPDAANKFLRLDYQIGTPVYAGVFRHVSMDWSQFETLTFRLKADDSRRSLSVMFKDASGNIWSKEFSLAGTDWVEHSIAFSEFKRYFGFGEMDLSGIVQIIFLIEKGEGEVGSGTIFIDDVKVLLETENTRVSERAAPLPNSFRLLQNFPNPFNSRTEIRYYLPVRSDVELVLFNVLGEQVKTIVQENQSSGWYRVSFDANDLASGVYLLQLRAGGFVRSRKVLVLR